MESIGNSPGKTTVLDGWRTAFSMGTIARHSQQVAQVCAGAVLLGAAVLLSVAWANSDLIVPYAGASFLLVGLILQVVTRPSMTDSGLFGLKSGYVSENIKLGLSIVLLTSALFEGIGLLPGHVVPFRTIFNLTPSFTTVALFFLLAVMGTMNMYSRWRYVVGFSIIIVAIIVFDFRAWPLITLFALSALAYLLMTFHWRNS